MHLEPDIQLLIWMQLQLELGYPWWTTEGEGAAQGNGHVTDRDAPVVYFDVPLSFWRVVLTLFQTVRLIYAWLARIMSVQFQISSLQPHLKLTQVTSLKAM